MNQKMRSLTAQFFRYLAPSVASLTSLSLYILADTYFISAGVGSLGLTALNIALPAYNVVTATGLMLGVGAGVLVAVGRGSGDADTANRAFRYALCASLVIGLGMSVAGGLLAEPIAMALGASADSVGYAATYLRLLLSCSVFFVLNNTLVALVRNDGNPRLAMLSMVCNSLCNVVLDYLFVLVFGWGMAGAAVATCISPVVGLGLISLHWLRGQNTLSLKGGRPKSPVMEENNRKAQVAQAPARLLLRIARGGAPSFLLELGNGLVIFLFNAALLGLAGDVAVASYGIIANISLVISCVFAGIGQGMQPVLGRAHGAGDREGCVHVLRLSLAIGCGAGLVFLAAGALLPAHLTAVFNGEGNRELAALTEHAMPIYFLCFPAMAANICCASYYQSTLRSGASLAISILRSLALVAAGIAILPGLWGLDGVWMVVPVTEGLTLLVCCGIGLSSRRRGGKAGAPPSLRTVG